MEVKTSKISKFKEGAKSAAKYVKHDVLVIGGTLLAAAAAVGIYSAIKTSNDTDLVASESTDWDADLAELTAVETTTDQS